MLLLRDPRGREALALFAVTLLLTVFLGRLEEAVSWLQGYTLVLVAAAFLHLPAEVLERQGLDPRDFGIHRRALGRATRWALLIMLLTFPPYLLGFHFWQGERQGRSLDLNAVHLARWPQDLEGQPPQSILKEGEVRFYAQGPHLQLRWNLPPGEDLEAWLGGEGLSSLGGNAEIEKIPGALRIKGGHTGSAKIHASTKALSLEIKRGGRRLPADQLLLGSWRQPAEEQPYRAERGLFWFLNLILVQLFLVALPEEVFYRGYLQSRLDSLIGQERILFGVSVNLESILLTSTLFALGHLATIPHPQRLAVFFPSLLFGWMRRASGGVAAPALYHAACNILVEIALIFYL